MITLLVALSHSMSCVMAKSSAYVGWLINVVYVELCYNIVDPSLSLSLSLSLSISLSISLSLLTVIGVARIFYLGREAPGRHHPALHQSYTRLKLSWAAGYL